MRAFLEKCEREWFDDFVYTARQPLVDMGVEIIPFDGNNYKHDLAQYRPKKTDIIIGAVDSTNYFFSLVGVEAPTYIGYPEELEKYYGRSIRISTVREAKFYSYPFFIKPANQVKLFNGEIIESESKLKSLQEIYGVSDDAEVYCSPSICIKSEYRCFVHKGELKGIKHYSGAFDIFPCTGTIRAMIAKYEKPPVSYTLDVAVLDNNRTVLVEVNDFWAIGGYGIDGKTYVRMLIDRFQEILNDRKF